MATKKKKAAVTLITPGHLTPETLGAMQAAAEAPAAGKKAPAADPLATLVDELGQIEKDLAPHAAKIARQKNLREAIRKQTPESQNEVHGERFVAVLGDRGNETVVDYPGIAKKIGYEKFAQFATATLKALAEHVKPGMLALFTRTEQSGPRTLKVLEKGQPAAS